jgi:hypothetical protein
VIPREIRQMLQAATNASTPSDSDLALVALCNLMKSFIEATEQADREGTGSTKAMSIDQIRVLNHLYIAVGA